VTLLLAVIGDDFGLLGADRLMTVERSDGTRYLSDGDKLFDVGGCAVASYGTNPAGISVPDFIRQSAHQRWCAADLAAELHRRRAALPDAGAYGLFVLGDNHAYPELWENQIDGSAPVQLSARTLHSNSRRLLVGRWTQLAFSDAAFLRQQLLNIFRQARVNAPLEVGPPYEIAEIRLGKHPQITRFP
jgi:hypothetical protein